MRLKRPDQSNFLHYTVMYTLVFACVMAANMSVFLRYGKSVVAGGDGFAQHFPALGYFGVWLRKIVRNILVTHSFTIPEWDFSIGFGAAVLPTLNYYCIGDPLALLSIFVPVRYTELLYGALIVLRHYLAGLAFSAFCYRRGKSGLGVLAGAFTYVFCGYMLYVGFRHPFFVNPLIYFPLLLIGAEKVLDGESPLVFILAVCISVVSNFYFFYMMVIGTVLYVVLGCLGGSRRMALGAFMQMVLRFLLYGAIGVAMGAVILLPTILVFLGGERTQGTRVDLWYTANYYRNLLSSVLSVDKVDNQRASTYIGFSAPALLAVFVLFGQKEHRGRKLGILLMTVMVMVPVFGSIMNGFNYVCNRWLFMFAALLGYNLADMWDDLLNLSPMQKRVSVCCGVGYPVILLMTALFGWEISASALAGCLFLLAALAAVLGTITPETKRLLPACLAALTVVNVCFNWNFMYEPLQGDYISYFEKAGDIYKRKVSGISAAAGMISDDEAFYRFEIDDTGNRDINSAMLRGDYGTASYWSLTNGNITDYMSDMGIKSINSYKLTGVNGRTAMGALAGVRYYLTGSDSAVPFGYNTVGEDVITNQEEGDEILARLMKEMNGLELTEEQQNSFAAKYYEQVRVRKNMYALPLGFTYTSYFTEDTYRAMTPLQRQEAMLQGVYLPDAAAVPAGLQQVVPELTAQSIKPKVKGGGGAMKMGKNQFLALEDDAKLTITFEGLPQCETYLQIDGLKHESTTNYDLYLDNDEKHYSHYNYYTMSEATKFRLLRKKQMQDPYDDSLLSIRGTSHGNAAHTLYNSERSTYYQGNDHLLNFGYLEEARDTITLTLPAKGLYTFDDMTVLCQPMAVYEQSVNALAECTMTDIRMGEDKITGNVETSGDRLLFLSIPYDKGWTAKIDGQKTPVLRANVMYMALPVTGGDHIIELTYHTYGIGAGMVISAVGFAAFAAVLILQSRNRSGSRRKKKR